MRRPITFAHDQWIRANIEAAGPIRTLLMPRLHNAKEVLRLAGSPQLPVYRVSGESGAGSISATFVNVRFANATLEHALFEDRPVRERAGEIPFWRCMELVNLDPCDITVVEASRHICNRLPKDKSIVFPQYVRHVVDTTGDWGTISSRFRPAVRKTELRLFRKHDFAFTTSRRNEDFEEFYHEFYVPTVQKRHGASGRPVKYSHARCYFKAGFLFQVWKDGELAATDVCYLLGETLTDTLHGVRGGNLEYLVNGASAMTYLGPIRWANENGCRGVDFQASNPFTNSGLFQYKRRWGGAISLPPDLFRRLWMRINRLTTAVENFLIAHPVVTVDSTDGLTGVIFVEDIGSVDQESINLFKKNCATPGMRRLLIRSTKWFDGKPVKDLEIPITGDTLHSRY